MPATTVHGIYYPSGTAVPNIPVQDQTQAESVEAALNKITKAPTFIGAKTANQTLTTAATFYDVTWTVETLKQGGITHATNSASIVVPEAGLYDINARISFNSGTAVCAARIQVNGIELTNTLIDGIGSTLAFPKLRVLETIKLNAGDIVKIRAQTDTASVTIGSDCTVTISKKAVY
jgi:hypothetical protein